MRVPRLITSVATAVLLVGSLAACGSHANTTSPNTAASSKSTGSEVSDLEKYGIVDNGDSITLTDASDEEVTIKKNPKRVVNTYNSYLALWYLLGGEVVGRLEPSEEKPVPEADGATIVGGTAEPNAEEIIALEPDLVLTSTISGQKDLTANLKASGIPVLMFEVDNREDYSRMCLAYSLLTGRDDLYKKYVTDMNASIDELIAKVPDTHPTFLLMMATAKGVTVKGNDSTNGEMFTDLGAVNVAEVGGNQEAADFSVEQVLEADPDFIFVTEMGADLEAIKEQRQKLIEDDPVWSSMRAVKEGHYIVLPKEWYTYKPNEDYLKAYTLLANYLYPDTFGEPSVFPSPQK